MIRIFESEAMTFGSSAIGCLVILSDAINAGSTFPGHHALIGDDLGVADMARCQEIACRVWCQAAGR